MKKLTALVLLLMISLSAIWLRYFRRIQPPVGVSAGSYTFQSPNTQSYKDAEKLWIDDWGNVNLVTESQLIGKDFANTIVKYENLKGKRAVYNGTSPAYGDSYGIGLAYAFEGGGI